MPRGRKLVLQYKDGSPCGADKSKRSNVREGSYRHFADDDEDDESKPAGKTSKEDQKPKKDKEDDKDDDDKDKDDDDDEDEDKKKKKEKPKHRKSATISFLCDRDPDVSTAISFVGTDPDECAYFFEARSQHACAGAEPHKPGSVGPASVFAIIFGITVLVYILGGVFYQRTVAHARGWRQLPNYSLWAGIWNFVRVRSAIYQFARLDADSLLGHLRHPHVVVRPLPPQSQGLPQPFRVAVGEEQEPGGREIGRAHV